jgi:hypothetical protein
VAFVHDGDTPAKIPEGLTGVAEKAPNTSTQSLDDQIAIIAIHQKNNTKVGVVDVQGMNCCNQTIEICGTIAQERDIDGRGTQCF